MDNLVGSVKKHGKGKANVSFIDVKDVLGKKPEYFDKYKAVVLSGGGGSETKAHKYIMDNVNKNATVVGVCRGHQYIAEVFGGKVEHLGNRQKGSKKIEVEKEDSLFKYEEGDLYDDTKQLDVYKDHIQGVTDAGELEVLASSTVDTKKGKQRIAEVIKHKDREIYGIQAHPEMGGHGTHVLNNILDKMYEKPSEVKEKKEEKAEGSKYDTKIHEFASPQQKDKDVGYEAPEQMDRAA